MDLDALKATLETFAGLDLPQAIQKGRDLFETLYCEARGTWETHDGQIVLFHKDRFEHAFFTSSNRLKNPRDKDFLSLERLERLRWIGPVIRGETDSVECWEVSVSRGCGVSLNRLYVVHPLRYVVWLEQRKNGGWKFSSAYVALLSDMAKYRMGARRVPIEKGKPRD